MSAPGASNTLQTVAVSLTVTLPDFVLDAVTAPTTGVVGSTISVSATLRNAGTATSSAFRIGIYLSSDAAITTADVLVGPCPYLTGLPEGVTSVCSGDYTIPSTLAPGTYFVGAIADDLLQVTESNETNNSRAATNTTVLSGVTLPVAPAIGLSPTSFSFTGQQGGANPAGQSLSISNSGGGTLGWTAATNQSWLTVSSASGTAPSTVTVSVNTAGLAAGSYSGTVTVSAPGASNTPQTVAVSLTVTSIPPVIGLSAASFNFTGQQGGANPAGQSLSISNSGGGTLGWTAATNQSWLTVSSASGTAPSTVTVSVNTAGLAAGSYSGTVTVSAPGASNTPQTVAVSLTVTSPPLPPDPGVVFRWPVSPENRFNTSQDYAHFGVVVANRYHTGMDIAATEGTSVVAAGAGTVRRLSMTTGVFNGDNHCMGNVVIIDHGGVFSLYAHLQSITVANGAVVSKGAQIGTVGRTPTTSRPGCNPPTGAHLHFEMKTRGVLGDLGDSGPNWGYTPGNPDQYGYVDPTLYFHTWILLSTRTVRTTGVVNARMGPNSTAPENYPVLESLAPDVPVTAVALASATAACTGGWYLVVRPSGAFFGGVPTAWICASLTAP